MVFDELGKNQNFIIDSARDSYVQDLHQAVEKLKLDLAVELEQEKFLIEKIAQLREKEISLREKASLENGSYSELYELFIFILK